ncbi:MAG: MBL fold metallo-hydrolase [Verrucomicrobiota bacterium]
MIELVNLSAGREIGSNCYLITFGQTRALLDAGTHPKKEGAETLPRFNCLGYGDLDAIFLTHAHLDHSGAIPVAMREHPNANVFMSEATRHLADAMLHNSVNVMTSKRDELEIHEYPLYTHRELDKVTSRWETSQSGRPFYFSDTDDVTCEFYDAGHILGAVSPLFEFEGRRILYTGDIHFEDQTLTRGAKLPEGPLDTVIVETTRGAVERREDYTRESEIERFSNSLNAILERGGSALVPVFAMGKTQELLITLHRLKEQGKLRSAAVHIGGLSTKMTQLYDRLASRTRRHFQDLKILKDIELTVASSKKRTRQIEYQPGCIYALSSGMMMEHTPSNKVARMMVENPKCGILFVGYADPKSPAGQILATAPGEKIQLNKNAPEQPLNCSVERFDFSGHATRESICDYLVGVQPKNVVLVHGDDDALAWFEAELKVRLPDSRIIIPVPEQPIEL